jgi:uncharacterized membrane protein
VTEVIFYVRSDSLSLIQNWITRKRLRKNSHRKIKRRKKRRLRSQTVKKIVIAMIMMMKMRKKRSHLLRYSMRRL